MATKISAPKAGKAGKPHSFHLVDPSPWPILTSLALFVAAIGGIFTMKANLAIAAGVAPEFPAVYSQITLYVGLALLIGCAWGWWADVVKEGTQENNHTQVVRTGLRMGMVLFIVSEVMFFVAFFWAYFNPIFIPLEVTGAPGHLGSADFMPPKIPTIPAFDIPYFNTLLLLLSGTTITWAHHALQENHNKETVKALAVTVLLGILFLFVQGYGYSHAPFGMADGIFSSSFYMTTGFHGFHVFVGTAFLMVCLYRAWRKHFKPDHHVGFEAAAWYWHFVDVVWLFLFISIYWWGGTLAAPN